MRGWILALLLAPSLASAVTVTVRGDGSGDYGTIGEAVAAAEGDSSIDTIDVGPGTWSEQVDLGGLGVALVGAGTGETIIDGGGQGPVIRIGPQSGGDAATVMDLTVQNGINAGSNGGCVAVQSASPTFEDVVIQDCEAPEGGCVALTDSDTTLLRVVVHECEATQVGDSQVLDGNGGGILVQGGEASLEFVRVFDCSAPGIGGAVSFLGGSGELSSVWFSDSHADWGGGLAVVNSSSVTGSGVSLADNTVCNGGGGVSIYSESTVVFEGVTVARNRLLPQTGACATGDRIGGGGLWAHTAANATITGGQFVENTSASSGGAAWVSTSSGGRFELVRVLGNTSIEEGGGLMARYLDADDPDPELDVIACHVAGNEAGSVGGGLHLQVDEGSVQATWMVDNTADIAGGGGAFESDQSGVLLTNNLFVDNTAGHSAGAIVQGANMSLVANTFAGGLCTDQASESGIVGVRTAGLGDSATLRSLVVGDATGCDYAVQAIIPVAGASGISASHGLFSPGSDATLNPGMTQAATLAGPPWYADPTDGPAFVGTGTGAVGDLQLVSQGGDRDGVDEGPANLGNDPDGTAPDLGGWGGAGASAWTEDRDGDGSTVYAGDCDDQNAAVSPSATEAANCIDDDCDGTVDEGFASEGPCWTDPPPGDDDDSAGDDDDSAATWAPPPGCIAECGVIGGGAGVGWLLVLGVLGRRRRR